MSKENSINPLQFFVRTILLIMGAGLAIMAAFFFLQPPRILEIFIDSVLRALLVTPVLYACSYRPLVAQLKKSVSAENLVRSEERYRALAESAPDTIFIVDDQQRLEYINRYGAGTFNATPALSRWVFPMAFFASAAAGY